MKMGIAIWIIGIFVVKHSLAQFDCPKPWEAFEDKCYKFVMLESTPIEAQKECATNGASLVSVNSRGEHDYIVTWLSNNEQLDRRWLTSGQRDSDDENRMIWLGDGTRVSGFQFWLSDEARAKGQTLVYKNDGQNWGWAMEQISGSERRPYVCEIHRANIYKIVDEERDFDFGSSTSDLDAIERGPHIVVEPRNTIYNPATGYTYTFLECVASGLPKPDYQWIVQRGIKTITIDLMKNKNYTLTNGRLTIHFPTPIKDNGDYHCIASNKFGSVISRPVQLGFGYLLDFPKSKRDQVTAFAFKGIGIECNAPDHYPEVQYTWYKDSTRNFIRTNMKPHIFMSKNGKLYFSMVTKDDIGDYTCSVEIVQPGISTQQGKHSLPIPLRVQETVASIREPQIVSGFPAVFPASPKKGDSVRIECFAWGTGELSYSWRKLKGNLPIGHTLTDNNRVLNIPDVKMVADGTYLCNVQRLNGQTSEGAVSLFIEARPFFLIPIKDQHVDAGESVEWRCIAGGKPTVRYQWYRDTVELTSENLPPGNRYNMSNNVLQIARVQKSDEGMFQCSATNLHGTSLSTGQLRVLSLVPSFQKNPLQRNTYAPRRGNATIRCLPEAAPRAEITWKRNGVNLGLTDDPTARIYKLPNGYLMVTDVRPGDAGVYSCEATNSRGSASSVGNLTVLGAVQINTNDQMKTVEVNKTTYLACSATYDPVLDLTYVWFHNNYEIEFQRIRSLGNIVYIEEDQYFTRGSGMFRGGLEIKKTQFFHAGKYTCIVRAGAVAVEQTYNLQVIGPPSAPIGVTGSLVTARSIQLKWTSTRLTEKTTSYSVEGLNLAETKWREYKSNIRVRMQDKEITTKIETLSPMSRYMFRVRAENLVGIGDPSEPSATYTTSEDRPLVSPRFVGGGGGKVGVLTITWEPLPRAEENGQGFGYIVKWKKTELEDQEWDVKNVTGREASRFVTTIGSSNYYRKYDVSVQAYNRKGLGPSSPVVTIWSAEGIPVGVSTNIRLFPYNGTALLVTWTQVPNTPESMKGVLKGYRINYWKQFGEDETMAIYRTVLGQRNQGIILGLESHIYYKVNVQAYNSAGFGPKSQDDFEETLRKPPQNAPTEVYVRRDSRSSVEVFWRGVSTSITEEPLQGYKVRYWEQGESHMIAKDLDSEKVTHQRMTNLKMNTIYHVRVFGYSRGGEGVLSSPTISFELDRSGGAECRSKGTGPDTKHILVCSACHPTYLKTLIIMLLLCTLMS